MPHLFKKQVLIKHHNLEQWRVIETKGTHYAKCEFGAIHVIHKTITRTRTLKGGGFGLTTFGTLCSRSLSRKTVTGGSVRGLRE